MAALQPPSFFQSTLEGSSKPVHEGTATLAGSQELENLKEQNASLRAELDGYRKMEWSGGCGAIQSNQVPHLLTPAGVKVPSLTSDLLHVEECLQSKVKLLEAEKREMSLSVLQLEKMLLELKKRTSEEREILLRDHKNAVKKLQHDLEVVSTEYQEHRKSMNARVEELEAQLHLARQEGQLQLQELQGKLTGLQQDNCALQAERQAEVNNISMELSTVRRQLEVSQEGATKKLADSQALIESLEAQLSTGIQKVQELEAYLGGEIPDLSMGKTWKEEREFLTCSLEKLERKNHKLTSESNLLNIRLDSINEILSVQEKDVTKRCGDDREAYHCLLTRWREKVFVLLVQRKLQDIEVARELEKFRRTERKFKEAMEDCERTCQLLSSAVTDKEAQLQLQAVHTKELEMVLEQADKMVRHLEDRLQVERRCATELKLLLNSLVQASSDLKATFHRSMTQLVNYDQRLALMSGHVQCVTVSLEGHRIRSFRNPNAVADAECQVGGVREKTDVGVVSLTREQLEQELSTLCQERDHLIAEIRNSSKSYREQIDRGVTEKEIIIGQLNDAEERCSSLRTSLEELQYKLEISEVRVRESSEKILTLQEELKQAEANAEEKLNRELVACRQKSREELAEMEKLLGLARREHSEAVMNVQQLTRKLTRDKDRAVQAAQMEAQHWEQEVMATRKKLQAIMVEKNLLLATLREEGISVPKKSRFLHFSPSKDETSGGGVVALPLPPVSRSNDIPNERDDTHGSSKEDIRDVLKDLQILSASLLTMEEKELKQTTGSNSEGTNN